MPSTVLRFIVDILGLLSLAFGLAGGIVTMFKEIQREADEDKSYGVGALPTAFIEANTKFLEALVKAPMWLSLVIIGILLIFGANWL